MLFIHGDQIGAEFTDRAARLIKQQAFALCLLTQLGQIFLRVSAGFFYQTVGLGLCFSNQAFRLSRCVV